MIRTILKRKDVYKILEVLIHYEPTCMPVCLSVCVSVGPKKISKTEKKLYVVFEFFSRRSRRHKRLIKTVNVVLDKNSQKSKKSPIFPHILRGIILVYNLYLTPPPQTFQSGNLLLHQLSNLLLQQRLSDTHIIMAIAQASRVVQDSILISALIGHTE